MGKTPCCEKVGLNKGLWSAEEDEILRSYIHANGEGSWRSLPKNAGLKRCGKSCRLRWVNYLRGDLMRRNITSEEEDIIIKMHNKIGNRSSVIAEHLPGRTDNEIKNYWNTYLSRKIYTIKRPLGESSSSTTAIDIVKLDYGCKRRKGQRKKNNCNPDLEIPTNAKDDKKSQNSGVFHHGPNIECENAGITMNSREEIETISWSSSPLFVNGEHQNEIFGPYQHGLDQSSMYTPFFVNGEHENDIFGPYHGLDQSSMFAPFFLNGEHENEIFGPYQGLDQLSMFANDNIITDDQLFQNEAKINTMMSEGESGTGTGGPSLLSNGAAECIDEWS